MSDLELLSKPWTVDIAVACSGSVAVGWWTAVTNLLISEIKGGVNIKHIHTAGSALPDVNKIRILAGVENEKRRQSLTDINRSLNAKAFLMNSDTEWLFWIDDDTIPPAGAIRSLLKHGKPFVAGLYFLAGPPHNPIVYYKHQKQDWGYSPMWDYPKGALTQVDAVGMGCTLIHRSVYEKIMEAHDLYVRPNGTFFPVLKKNVLASIDPPQNGLPRTYISNGRLHQEVHLIEDDDQRPWPFYSLEYGRTEDMWFCEMAAEVGIRPWVDTRIVCRHLKQQEITEQTYLDYLDKNPDAGVEFKKVDPI
jgi:hypothetical protein